MKKLLPLSAALFLQCSEELSFKNLSAEQFVEAVKNGQYDADVLPPLQSGDITVLLSHAGQNQDVSSFVVSPISSYLPVPFSLTESLLWTVEAIRLDNDLTDKLLPLPSLAPKLRKRDAQGQLTFANEADYVLAFQAYNAWWEDTTISTFEEKQKIYPLENLGLFWY